MTTLNEPFLSPYEEARRKGAEAMRERAARECVNLGNHHARECERLLNDNNHDECQRHAHMVAALDEAAAAIRRLEVE